MKSTFIYLVITLIITCEICAEIQVNTKTYHNQANPAIAEDANGNFIVVWNSYYDYSDISNDIHAQQFNFDGTKDANNFTVNQIRTGNQKEPDIASDDTGNFVVVWQSKDANDNTTNIFARRFDPNVIALGDEFQVSTDPNSKHPKIAMNDTGQFVIVWEHNISITPTIEASYIKAQIFDSNGTAVGTNFDVHDVSGGHNPDVGIDDIGSFAVTWMQDDVYHSGNFIMAKQFFLNGSIKTDAFDVTSTGFDTKAKPSISMSSDGHFLITWDSAQFGQLNNIFARRYKFDGSFITDIFKVNTIVSTEQQNPTCTMNNQREFIIAWESETEPNSNQWDIAVQRFDSFNNPIGNQFQINAYDVNNQTCPAISIDENGNFITAWQSYDQDGSMWGIFAEFGPLLGKADFNGDLFVNFLDYCFIANEWLKETNPLQTDLVDDNKIDQKDIEAFTIQWLKPIYDCSQVDLYDDNIINFLDFAVLANSWSKKGTLAGDITGNGAVDADDLKVLLFHWLNTCE